MQMVKITIIQLELTLRREHWSNEHVAIAFITAKKPVRDSRKICCFVT